MEEPRLHTFGRAELISSEPLPSGGLTAGRPLMLLVYLMLNPGRTFARAHIADLLWGDDRGDGARKRALRQALYVVRKALPSGCVEADAHHVRVVRGIPSDAADLETAFDAADADEVARLFRGPFLADLIEAAPSGFERWAEEQRRYFDRRAAEVLLDVARDAAFRKGDAGKAEKLLEAAGRVERFDLSQELWKARIWLALGRTSSAAGVAREALIRCSELGIPVEDEVRSQLEAAASGPPVEAAAGPGPAFPTSPQLTGRARERAELLAAWQRALDGEGVTVLVAGDPGIGKSRLISEVIAQARTDGAIVLEGRGYALESRLLYGALIEVLHQSFDAPGFAGVGDVWLAELSRLLPELRERYPTLTEPASDDPGGRRRFYESVAQVFEALAYEQPVFCVLDDLHWADEATLELLHYLGRRLCGDRVLFVAGLRPGEASEALRRLRDTLVREQGGVLIELGPLDEDEIGDLASSMFGHRDLPAPLTDLVWQGSEGNPFFAVSMVETLAERGCVSVGDTSVTWNESRAKDLPSIPRRIKEIIGARLALLAPDEASLLEAGAVAGRSFSSEIVAAITERDPEEVDARMSSLAERHLVRRRTLDGPSLWEFTHDRIREAVYEGLAEDERAAFHSAMARAESARGGGAEPSSAARHAALAGDRASAFRHAMEAAEWARSVFAFEGARDMLRVALANAPDAQARALAESEMSALPHPRPGTTTAPPRRTLRRLALAVPAVTVLLLGGVELARESPHEAGPPPPPPLPAGILARVEGDRSSYLGVLDSDHPDRPIRRLPATELPAFKPSPYSQVLLSPDGRWVATAIARDGGRPDLYVFHADGSDTLRLTHNTEDDIPKAWFPDGRHLLVVQGVGAGTPEFAYRPFVVSFDGGPPRPIVPEALEGKWWFGGDGRVSPDGTKVALFLRSGGRRSVWVMDIDGRDAERLEAVERNGNSPTFSPDAARLAFVDQNMRRLVIMDLTTRAASTVDLPGPMAGHALFWSRDGTHVLLSLTVDDNAEIFSVRRDGSELHRVTYSNVSEILAARVGSRPPYVDRVAIVAAGATARALLVGDSMPVAAVAKDSSGTVLPNVELRVGCVSEAVCDVRDGWLHGRAVGRTSLVASAGGWRADTLAVEVVSGAPALTFSEDWEHGIAPGVWKAFGEPAAILVPGRGRGGSVGFQANGDGQWNSGVITRRSFPTVHGLSVDFWGRGEFDGVPWPSWEWLDAGFTPDSTGAFNGAGPFPHLPLELSVVNGLRGTPATIAAGGKETSAASVLGDTDAWHRYTVQLLPDGAGEVWVDGRRFWHGTAFSPVPSALHVVIQGRATAGPVIDDDVRVYEGVLLPHRRR